MAQVLLIAPTCDGDDVGEAWVAFQWASRLARRHDVTVLTYHKRGKRTAAEQLPGVRVIEWIEPPLLWRAERLNSLLKPGYLPFYWRARRWIRAALAAGEHFDVAHQVSPVAMRYPSPAIGLGIPVVIGPTGGSLDSPAAFRAEEGTAPWFMALRNLDHVRLRFDPVLRRTYREAACVLGIAPYVRELLGAIELRRFEVLSDTGLSELPEAPAPRAAHDGVRLVHVGRLVRTKGVRDVVRALAQVADPAVVLDVVGDGPERGACETLVSELGLGSRVTFHVALPKAQVTEFYRRADVFVFPSYREPGGTVVFEAMGAGLPLVVVDRGGPAASVDEHCAIRLPVTTPEALAKDLAEAITRLSKDPELRRAMGLAARQRLQEYGLWESKLDIVDRLYRELTPRTT